MSQYEPAKPLSGWVVFAGVLLIMVGTFNILNGLVAIFKDDVYAVTEEAIVAFNFTGWGIVHLILGALILAAGFGVFSGQAWARAVGITVAALNAIAQIAFINAFPLWALTIIGIDVLVIYGLAVHGEEVGPA